MRKTFWLLLLWLASNAHAVIRYVDSTSPGGNDGLSWATAWDNITQITGVGAGDTVYVSGGTTSKTYTLSTSFGEFNPPSGSPGNPFTLSIGREAGHDGMAIFQQGATGGGVRFLSNVSNCNWVTLDGYYNGTQHFQTKGYQFLARIAQGDPLRTGLVFRGFRQVDNGILWVWEVDQCEVGWMVWPLVAESGATLTKVSGPGKNRTLGYGRNSIHDCEMTIGYHRNGNGNDGIKESSSTDIYNNRIIGVLDPNPQTGGDHQDGFQSAGGTNFTRFYNNYFENMSNYMIYLENVGQNFQIYNNVFNYSDSVLASGPSVGIALGAHNSGLAVRNVTIANNTFRGANQSISLGDTNGTMDNTVRIVNNIRGPGAGGINLNGGGTATIVNTNNPILTSSANFVNMAAGDFRLTASATLAINQGVNPAPTYLTSVFTTDASGAVRVNPWDAGAYEFGAGGGDPTPFINTATINTAGTQVAIVFSEAVQIGAGGPNGWVLSMSGGDITIPNQTPTGTGTTRTYTFGSVRIVGNTETGTIVYTQPGNGIEDLVGGDMVTGSIGTITNTSTVPTTNAPVFAPVSGSYFGTQNIVMTSSTPGATIRYTTNGSDPTASSTQYTAGATGIPTSNSTTYRAKAFSGGAIDSSITTAAYELGTWVTSGTAWKSFPVTSQTGTFSWTFRASASQAATDGVIGLSSVLPDGFNDIGPIIQFNVDNTIKARNGANYEALNSFTYVPGTTYEIACTVNIANRTYSITAAQIGGSPVIIGTNYAWRSDSPVAPELDNFGMSALAGSVTVSQMSFGTVTGTIPSLTGATIGSNGTSLTLGFSVPVVYGTGGSGGWTISASGGAATLTPTANPTTFTVSRPIATGETGTISYVQPGNGVEAVTGGGDLATLTSFAFNNQSTADLTAPIPNPMTFSAIPSALSSFSVTMTASVATDASTPPVQYYFDETSGNPGGADSGWTTSRTYTNSQLSPGIQYTYRVMARDSAAVPNQTTPSSSVNVTTPIIAGGKVITPARTTGAGFFNP